MSKSRYMPLYKNGLQFGWAKNLTDVVEQIVCSQVRYIEKKDGGYNIKTYDCVPDEDEESAKRRRDEIDRRFRLNRKRRQRFRVFVDGKYSMCYPTIDDFLLSIVNVHVLFVDVEGTQIWMTTAKKHGSPARTMSLCFDSLERHNARVKRRLDKYFAENEGEKSE